MENKGKQYRNINPSTRMDRQATNVIHAGRMVIIDKSQLVALKHMGTYR